MSYNTRSGQVVSNKHKHVKQFADYTSEFRHIDINTLNVEYQEVKHKDELCEPCDMKQLVIPEEVYMSNLDVNILINNKELFDKLDKKTKTFVKLIEYIMENESLVRGTEESRTSAFVNHLLDKLDFGEYPLMIQPQPLYKFNVYTKEISSKFDFAIMKDTNIMIIDEDKHIRNTGPPSAWGEYQIAGELIAGAYCNYSKSSKKYKDILYAVRVIGIRFTFYKAKITSKYLDSLGEGFPISSVVIKRYPYNCNDRDFPYLDYGDANEREEIISILIRIRESILNE